MSLHKRVALLLDWSVAKKRRAGGTARRRGKCKIYVHIIASHWISGYPNTHQKLIRLRNQIKCDIMLEMDTILLFDKRIKECVEKGIVLSDGTVLLSALLERVGETENRFKVTIKEGKYHQIKRMFASLGGKVTKLHRDSIGGLSLDKTLKPGEARLITKEELSAITDGKTPA